MRTLEEDRTPEQDINEQDDTPDAESDAPLPPPPPQSRIHSTHAQKGDDLQKLMDDTNKRAAALPVMPRAAAHAPAPLFHQPEPAAQQPEPAAVHETGASKPRQRKPVKQRAKQPAKRRDSDESTSDDSSEEDASSDSEDEPESEALEIFVAHRTYRRRIQYLVKWANGPKGESYEPSWEPKENVGLPLIEEYDAKLSSQPPAPAAGAPAKRKRSDEPAVNPAVNLAANIATAKPKRTCSIALACVPDAPPPLPPPPPPPPARVAMTLNRQGVDPSVRYGTITGLLENTMYDELQVKASMVDDYGNGVFDVKNDEEVYIIGEARCESSSKTFYRVSTWDGCVGFILSQFVELEA